MSSVHVSVRSLPRCEEIPRVNCNHSEVQTSSESSESNSPIPSEDSSPQDENKLGVAAGFDKDSEEDLRKTLVKQRFNECSQNLPRSDSMDSMLGDSLLDPPQSLQKIPPKRYQSPSRCGSPSLEAPDHLLFGSTSKNNGEFVYVYSILRKILVQIHATLHKS